MCFISLCDDCKMFQIASKIIGFCLSGALTSFSVGLILWWVSLDNKWMWYISLCIDGGGFFYVYYDWLFSFPHSHDCNPYPITFGFPVVVVLFLQPRVMVVGLFLLSFDRSIPRSSFLVAIKLICIVWLWGDTSYTSTLCQKDICVFTSIDV